MGEYTALFDALHGEWEAVKERPPRRYERTGCNWDTTDLGWTTDPQAVGFLMGLLVGEGHFGGDDVQPHVVLNMSIRHEETFRWIERNFPGARVYGPYAYEGRATTYRWMARGPYLRNFLAPLIHRHRFLLDPHVASRFDAMCERYAITLE